MQDLLLDTEVVLQKMQMKGGWTYALLPPALKGGKKNFGWTRVDAMIDNFELKNTSLMPIKGGQLFIAVKAQVRKEIGKEAGDTVRIRLYGQKPVEDAVTEDDFYTALKDDPEAVAKFATFPKKEQDAYVSWIFDTKSADVIVERIASSIGNIALGKYCKIAKGNTHK